MPVTLDLDVLAGQFAVCKIPHRDALPDWADNDVLCAVTRAKDELSVVCPETAVPDGIEMSGGWSAICVNTTFDFDEPGVVLSAVQPISEAGLGVFVISTFLRDYVLVRRSDLPQIRELLIAAGHRFVATH